MTRTVHLTIPGTPVAKARPRFTRDGRTYTDRKTIAYENTIRAAYMSRVGLRTPAHDGPVSVQLVATFTPPKSWSATRRRAALHGELDHLVRPDVDNVAKSVLDALNQIAWRDDAQVTAMSAQKVYGPAAQLVIVIHHHTRQEPNPCLT